MCMSNMWYEMYISFFQVSSIILKIKDSSKASGNLYQVTQYRTEGDSILHINC